MPENVVATGTSSSRSSRSRLHTFFRALLSPPRSMKVSDEYLLQSSYAVLVILYYGTLIFISLLIFLLFVSFALLQNTYVLGRIVLGGILFAYVAIGFWRLRAGNERLAASLLLLLYGFIATLAVMWWSISVPFGLLMFGFVIVLAGITLGPRWTLPTAVVTIIILFISQLLAEIGFITPDRSRIMVSPTFGDVANFGAAFLIIALVSWLSGRQLRGSLTRALAAEKALEEEKQNLSRHLAERTRKLQAAQLKEMQQLYRFAELGQLSTALLHDLANHLTVLTLDIEDIDKKRHSQAIARAKQSIFYLDKMVEQVRGQLQEGAQHRTFNVSHALHEVLEQVKQRAQKSHVQLEIVASGKAAQAKTTGDITRFRQIITILVTNAIDAYQESVVDEDERRVLIGLQFKQRSLHISVRDWGSGISKSERGKVFKPFYSTKEEGMGIGLFIAKQMVETHFKGSIELVPTLSHTEFLVKLKAK